MKVFKICISSIILLISVMYVVYSFTGNSAIKQSPMMINNKNNLFAKNDVTITNKDMVFPSKPVFQKSMSWSNLNKTNRKNVATNKIVKWRESISAKLEHVVKSTDEPKQNVSAENNTLGNKAYDILNMMPIPFNSSFKNPCWYGRSGLFSDGQLHCLPYFFILGVKKSGTSDLYGRITVHPQVAKSSKKELQWFGRLRWREPDYKRNVSYYISMFDPATRKIETGLTRMNGHPYHNLISVDATPSNLHLNTNWEKMPGNEGLLEPRYTHLDYIKHLIPQAKIIIIMRDPVTRSFSDFLHMAKLKRFHGHPVPTAEMFHEFTEALLQAYTTCFQTNTLRQCVHNNTIRNELMKKGVFTAESFAANFYYVYLTDIYNVFPKDQVLPLITADYSTDMTNTLETVYRFLELDPLSPKQMHRALSLHPKNRSGLKEKVGPMLPKTKLLLANFFKPFKKKTADFMNDSRYMFNT